MFLIRVIHPSRSRGLRSGPDEPVRMTRARWRVRVMLAVMLVTACPVFGAILWSDPGATLVYDSGPGRDFLDGALKRDDTSTDTLYFKLHIDPLSDSTTEEYFAAFELFEGDESRLAIGNAPEAWAYSVFLKQGDYDEFGVHGTYIDLQSSALEQAGTGTQPRHELPRRGVERTLVFKVQFVAGGEDLVTVWLNPDLSAGATEIQQSDTLTTRFNADASFDEIRLRHGGGGGGWVFSDLAIATSFADFVDPSSAVPRTTGLGLIFDTPRFRFQTWYREPGMPRGAIGALAQTTDGFIWLAGEDQIARFDGVRFVALDVREATGDARVQTLFGDSHGALWIGTAGSGILRYTAGESKAFRTEEGLPTNEITTIAEDSTGRVWIGTTSGLMAWQDGILQKLEGVEPLEGCVIKSLFLDHTGCMWIGVESQGVFRFQSGVLSHLTDPRVDDLLRHPQGLLVDREGRLWVGAAEDFVLCREDEAWHRYRIPRESGSQHLRALASIPDGTVWAGSASEGLFQFREGRLVALNTSAGLRDSQTASLFVDREGQLWIGGGAGLHLLRRDSCFRLGHGEGLGHGAVGGVAEVAPGVMWALQSGRGLFRWEGRYFRRLSASGVNPADGTLGAMLVTRNGDCWMACTNGLLLVRDPQAVADETLLFELPGGQVRALVEAQDGSLWAGTREGKLWRLHQGHWTRPVDWEASQPIAALASAPDGTIWVGTDGDGLYRVNRSSCVRLGTEAGLLSEVVRALYQDAGGTLWIGTDGGGLVGMSNTVVRTYTTEAGLPDDRISGILEDCDGHLWLADSAGLTCITKPSLAASAVKVLGVYFMPSSRVEETAVVPGSERAFSSGCRARSGQLWFATLDGILVAEPPEVAAGRAALSLILEKVLVDGKPATDFTTLVTTGSGLNGRPTTSSTLELGPGRHRVEIQFTSPFFGEAGPPRFRYQMVGLDPDWVEAGAERKAIYSFLPPGDYQFNVMVDGEEGNTNRTSIGFLVARHLWQHWWFLAASGIGLAVTIGGGARVLEKRRMNHRLHRLEQEHALERERTRIAQDLHDEMGAKLCRISFLSEHAHRLEPSSNEIREQIATIAADSRELLHSLDEIVWVVNPQNDTLEHVASYTGQYAQNYYQGTGIECELDISGDLPHVPVSSQIRHHLFLAMHEALTNILKHSEATQVKVTLAYVNGGLHLGIQDNGTGFAPLISGVRTSGGEESRNGLSNMQHRMESIGGRCQIRSTPGIGTTIEFVLPLPLSTFNPSHT